MLPQNSFLKTKLCNTVYAYSIFVVPVGATSVTGLKRGSDPLRFMGNSI